MKIKNNYKILTDDSFENVHIVLKSLLVGLLAGAVTVLYRVTLTKAEHFAFSMYGYFRSNLQLLPLLIILLILAAYFVGHLVARNPMISGSGIPQLEGILKGHFRERKNWLTTLFSKFLGGTIAIGAGLSLGREGPSIQLGANVAEGLGKKIGRGRLERKVLMASGASAGLAAAFNAPMAGVVFALEEIFKYFSPVIILSLMSAAVAADFVSKQVFGLAPIFHFEITQAIPLNDFWLLIILGIVLGFMGAMYNYFLLKTKMLYEKTKFLNTKTKIIVPFVFAGVLGIFYPVVLGGGHRILEELTLGNQIGILFLILVIKFIFSMVSYGSGTPGGIFFPLIILGGTIGAIFAKVAIDYLEFDQGLFNNFIILAMAGYFTAIVRAPVTGIVLIMEMTGSFTNMLPLTVVAVTAYVVADLIKSPPIYEALLEELTHSDSMDEVEEHHKKILVEIIVKHSSKFADQQVKDIVWPGKTLLVGVKKGNRQIIPKGDTLIKEGDYLTILTDINSESRISEIINEMNLPQKE